MTIPQQNITIGSYDLSAETLSFDVTLRENAVSSCVLLINDYESKSFVGKCDIADNVKVQFRFADKTSNWTQLFGGWITDLEPTISMDQGEILKVTAIGYGQALVNMLVRQQYGSQSANSSLNTIKEILTDATYGIIPKYVNKVMASATDSGFSINTTKAADLTSDFRYLYFPGKPATKCLADMIDLISAANAPAAGAHWTIVPDDTTAYLCLATIGSHENPPADVWPTWWNTDQAGSTIEVKKDMIRSPFHKKRSEANYVLYVGDFRRPPNGDIWTENNSGDWGTVGDMSVNDDNSLYKIGSYSIRLDVASTSGHAYYPSTANLSLDITQIGTQQNIPRLFMYVRHNDKVDPSAHMPQLRVGTGAFANDDYFFYLFLSSEFPATDEWGTISFPIGPYYSTEEKFVGWGTYGSPSWSDIDYVSLFFTNDDGGTASVYLDGLHFFGRITRAAYDSGKYPTQNCKMKYIRDDVPKDDSLSASDDSGQMAQFCKAELYRCVIEPTIGQIVIPMQENIKAGQLTHIHFGKQADGSFRVDTNMRCTLVRHHFEPQTGALTYLDVTDDVTNSQGASLLDAYELLLKAVSPNFRDRPTGSLIAGDVDVTQTILAKSYST